MPSIGSHLGDNKITYITNIRLSLLQVRFSAAAAAPPPPHGHPRVYFEAIEMNSPFVERFICVMGT